MSSRTVWMSTYQKWNIKDKKNKKMVDLPWLWKKLHFAKLKNKLMRSISTLWKTSNNQELSWTLKLLKLICFDLRSYTLEENYNVTIVKTLNIFIKVRKNKKDQHWKTSKISFKQFKKANSLALTMVNFLLFAKKMYQLSA